MVDIVARQSRARQPQGQGLGSYDYMRQIVANTKDHTAQVLGAPNNSGIMLDDRPVYQLG